MCWRPGRRLRREIARIGRRGSEPSADLVLEDGTTVPCEGGTNRVATVKPLDTFSPRFTPAERHSLLVLCYRPFLRDRMLCIEWLRAGERVRGNTGFIIRLAGKLARDRRTPVRWGALECLEHYVETHPRRIWPVAAQLGRSPDPDLRGGVACALLEHLLQYHYDTYFPKIRDKIESGDQKMLEMLGICYRFGQAERHEDEIDALLRKHSTE